MGENAEEIKKAITETIANMNPPIEHTFYTPKNQKHYIIQSNHSVREFLTLINKKPKK